MKKSFFFLIFFLGFIHIPFFASAQRSTGGIPAGLKELKNQTELPALQVEGPDVMELLREDENREPFTPERMGVSIPVDLTMRNAGNWHRLANGDRLWRLKIQAKSATGLGLYFNNFHLAPGASLFVYSDDGSHVIGAFTSGNNRHDGFFATEVVKGDCIIVEFLEPAGMAGNSDFTIEEILYVYRPMMFPGDHPDREVLSGSCQVNTACSEGDEWRDQIKSVVRIQIKNGFVAYWCTGTIMNNTAADYSPYVLTADHCAKGSGGDYASAEDVSKWIFYFRYETDGCENNSVEANKTLLGARKISSSSPLDNNGSDFYLVLLNENIPPAYEPFYAGWDIAGTPSPSGVGIHHPSGDVKKISTYLNPLTNSQWGVNPGTHFKVIWNATANGHGTTEGGSSGSPLFDNKGRVIGQLTGGESGCYNLNGPDYYGKISFSWLSNGSADSVRLMPWLDPVNSGLSSINGSYNEKQVVARFLADTTVIPVGSLLKFSDLSMGNPISWYWEFEGGEPAASTAADPGEIRYNTLGLFNVKLSVTNAFGVDSLIREKYIRVVPEVFPNPAQDEFYILLGRYSTDPDEIRVYNAQGKLIFHKENTSINRKFISVDCSRWPAGMYLVEVRSLADVYSRKLLKVKR
ncbi:MAG: T9SS type A sorting domain-containing protein [Lentimicrobium sp.]|uniref:T9SS type A sorting domain-containing protein n=1 Tax=Lentimicrobium sp. TaxID=2034841 RepID=UPI0025D3A124|nr:T9SS type A sorting domain-containing protein [Lentimicrobium sp.]MCO5256422.1 T9SS type A sorting domain-containing protein [Lentimicrobium sp.]